MKRQCKQLTAMRLAFFLAILATLSCAVACKKEATDKKVIAEAQIAVVSKKSMTRTIEGDGVLQPIAQAAITPKISAPVRSFNVQRGDKVRKGQLLATLESADLSAAALENHGNYEQANAAYSIATRAELPEAWRRAELERNAARETLDAQQKLYNSRQDLYQQGALPRKELDQAALALTSARNSYALADQHLQALHATGKDDQLRAAHAQLVAAHGRDQQSRALLSYAQLRSPIDGVVADRPFYAGETAASGAALLTVVDLSKLIVRLHLAPSNAAYVRVGMAATLRVDGLADAQQARVSMVSPAPDVNGAAIEVWVEVANPRALLHAGLNAHVSIAAEEIANALVIPAESLLTANDGKTTVFIVDANNVAHQVEVRVGLREQGAAQILDGLREGARVVSTGAYGLADGMSIAPPQSSTDDAGKEQK